MCPVPTKRLVLLAASVLLFGTLIVSLRGISYTPPDQQSKEDSLSVADPLQLSGSRELVSLRVVVSLPDEAYRGMQALNRNFLLENTDMTVRLSNLKEDALDEYLQRAFRLGEVSDIILLDNELVKHHAGHARLQPTDDYFTTVTETEYLPVVIEQLKWNGYIWGIPFQIEPYILAYNEAVWLELTGERSPGDAEWLWTIYQYNGLYINERDPMAYAALAYMLDQQWQFPPLADAEEAADASDSQAAEEGVAAEEGTAGGTAEPGSTPDEDQGVPRLNEPADELVTALLEGLPRWQVGAARTKDAVRASSSDAADPADPSGPGVSSAVSADTDSDGGAEGQEQWMDMTLWTERFAVYSTEDPWERLRSGELAAIIAPLHEYESRRSGLISAILLPTMDGGDGALLTGKSFVLSAESNAQEAAFRWIRAILDSYHDEVSASVAGGYPADAEVYRLFVNNPTYGLLRSAVEKGHTLLPDPYIGQKLSLIREQLPKLVQEHLSSREAMMRIYAMFEEAGWLS